MDDRLFLEIVKKTGFPLEPQLRRCRELQAGAKGAGEEEPLFEIARRHGILSGDQAARFLELARGAAPPRRAPSARNDAMPLPERALRGVAFGLALLALFVLVLLLRRPDPIAVPLPYPRPVAVPVSLPVPVPLPAPAPDATAAPTTSSSGTNPAEVAAIAAQVALDAARALARLGQEPEAVDRLDEALAGASSPERETLEAEKKAILATVSERMDRDFAAAEEAARAGDQARVSSILDALYPHIPAALADKRRAAYDKLLVVVAAPPARADPAPMPSQAAALSDEAERVLAARTRIDEALSVLDVGAAREAVVADAKDPDLAVEAGNDAARVDAVSELLIRVRAGAETAVGKEVTLALRKGGSTKATLKKVAADRLVCRIPFQGERELKLGELAPATLLELARRKGPDPLIAFGGAVLLALAGDLDSALLELTKARALPQAALFRLRLEREALLRARDPADKKSVQAERRRHLDDARDAGGWKIGRASRHYDILSNGTEQQVREVAFAMDLMCDEYARVFAQKEPPIFSILLYKDRAEFQAKTKSSGEVLGFYDGEKIVSFFQETPERTRTTLFHEGTHQFEGLVFGKNIWGAPTWFVEGLAVYFEASRIENQRLVTGVVSKPHLVAVQRALANLDEIPLVSLIRTKPADFSFKHYAHAWSLIYFLVHGTQGGRERIRKYFDGLREGKRDANKLFEELFNRPTSEIEEGWKEYVKTLS